MNYMKYKEILSMIVTACNSVFYSGSKDSKDACIDAATKIYIEQMRIKAYGPTGYSEQYEAQEDLDNYE